MLSANEAILRELANRRAWKAGVIGAMNVAVMVLAVRVILLASVLGSMFLAWIATRYDNPARLAALAIYTGSVVLPIVWLAARR